MKRWILMTMTLVAVGGLVAAYMAMSGKADAPNYLLGKVDRGDIVIEVGATGTLQPVTLVQVGTRVSGTISELHADFNTQVEKGQLLAKLDPSNFQTQVEQALAGLQSAEASRSDTAANVEVLRANLARARVDLMDKERKWQRSKELAAEKLIPRDDLDTAEYAAQAAKAALDAGEAQLKSGQARLASDAARVSQARASLEQARVSLAHTVITAPISGTVISRNVDVGQTVAASFSAPTLFTLAADLSKMSLYTNIDEADMARISEGKAATFTVDAYRGETFHGTINQVRLSPTTVQNVVTYNAIIGVENRDFKLKPGMTANVKIRIESKSDVLRVPNGALRFQPEFLSDVERQKSIAAAQDELRKAMRARFEAGDENSQGRGANRGSGEESRARRGDFQGRRPGSGGEGGWRQGAGRAGGGDQNQRARPVVWIPVDDKEIKPVAVRTGATDGIRTEVLAGLLKEGDAVITGTESSASEQRSPLQRPPGQPGRGGAGGFMRGIR